MKAGPRNGSSRASRPFLLRPDSTSCADCAVASSLMIGVAGDFMVPPMLSRFYEHAARDGGPQHGIFGLVLDPQMCDLIEWRDLQHFHVRAGDQPQFLQVAQELSVLRIDAAHDSPLPGLQ